LGSHGVVVPTVAVVATMLLVATLQNLGTPGCPSPCGPRSPRRRSSRSSTTTHACRDGSRRFRGSAGSPWRARRLDLGDISD